MPEWRGGRGRGEGGKAPGKQGYRGERGWGVLTLLCVSGEGRMANRKTFAHELSPQSHTLVVSLLVDYLSRFLLCCFEHTHTCHGFRVIYGVFLR